MIFFNHISTLPLTITGAAGYKARVFGGLVAVNGLLIAMFEMGTVDRLRHFRRLRVAALGMVLTGLGFGLTGMVLHWALVPPDRRAVDVRRDPERALHHGLYDGLGAAAHAGPLPELAGRDLEPGHRPEPAPVPARCTRRSATGPTGRSCC